MDFSKTVRRNTSSGTHDFKVIHREIVKVRKINAAANDFKKQKKRNIKKIKHCDCGRYDTILPKGLISYRTRKPQVENHAKICHQQYQERKYGVKS